MQKILIVVPTFENIQVKTFESIYNMDKPTNANVVFNSVKGYAVDKCRCRCAELAMNGKYDWMLTIDSDIIVPKETLTKLLSHDKHIVTGWYMRKRTKTDQTVCFDLSQNAFNDKNTIYKKDIVPGQLLSIRGMGLGCCLIHTDVFRTLNTKHPFQYKIYDSGKTLSEDLYFCNLARSKGYKIFLDTDVACQHIWTTIN